MKAFWNWLKSLFSAKQTEQGVSPSEPVIPIQEAASKYESLYAMAKSQEGQKEIYGSQDNPQIVQYFSATSYGPAKDETPWCAAFVNWCLKQIGEKGTNSAAAKSFDTWGRKLEKPVRGCIVCIEHLDSEGRKNGRRHVTLFDRYSSQEGFEYHLGGNQNNSVNSHKVDSREVNSYRGFN